MRNETTLTEPEIDFLLARIMEEILENKTKQTPSGPPIQFVCDLTTRRRLIILKAVISAGSVPKIGVYDVLCPDDYKRLSILCRYEDKQEDLRERLWKHYTDRWRNR